MSQKSYDGSACLYLVPTPIGNLEDITLRSLSILNSVEAIFCEDTRESSKLLNHFDIKKKLISCHEYNEDKAKESVLAYLVDGKSVALITDQGSPIISDPGYVVAKEVINNGYNVVSLPGATAFVPALTSSGLVPSPFVFYGFLSNKRSKRIEQLKCLKDLKYTTIFYESPHRVSEMLEDMLEILGDRNVALCRELSKKYEEVIRERISNMIGLVDNIKGEIVLVVEGNNDVVDYSSLTIVEHVKIYTDDGMSEKEAIKLVAKERNVAKSVVYKAYHIDSEE